MRELLVLPSQLLVLLVLRLQPLHQRDALRAQLLRSLLFLAPPPVGRLALNLELSRHLLRAQLLHVHFVELLLQLEPLHQWKRHGTALVRLLCVQQEFVRAARHAITPATARALICTPSDLFSLLRNHSQEGEHSTTTVPISATCTRSTPLSTLPLHATRRSSLRQPTS